MADATVEIDAGKRPVPRRGILAGMALFFMAFLMLSSTGERATYDVVNWAPDCSGDVYALKGEPLLPTTV